MVKPKDVKVGRITVEFTDDPHTAILVNMGRSYSSTFWCALGEGTVSNTENDKDLFKDLTKEEYQKLEELEDLATDWESELRGDDWDG